MKAIICAHDGNIHLASFGTEWTAICANTKAKWTNPVMGTVVVAARNRDTVRLLGLHNTYLLGAMNLYGPESLSWLDYRSLHEGAIEAPGYVFDKARIGCWAAVVKIGFTSDVRWATDEEYLEVFPE